MTFVELCLIAFVGGADTYHRTRRTLKLSGSSGGAEAYWTESQMLCRIAFSADSASSAFARSPGTLCNSSGSCLVGR